MHSPRQHTVKRVIGKDGKPVERITVYAPEMHAVNEPPPPGGVIRFTDRSKAARVDYAYAGQHHIDSVVTRFLCHQATAIGTVVLLLVGGVYGAIFK